MILVWYLGLVLASWVIMGLILFKTDMINEE
jgi:hypothetical protein